MSKANKVITGYAVNVKYLDRAAYEKGTRKIVKTRISPMVCQTDLALASFMERQLDDLKNTQLLPEFEIWNAVMQLGKRAEDKDHLIDTAHRNRQQPRVPAARGSALKDSHHG